MFTHPQQGLEKDEVANLRKKGGAWLRKIRMAAGISQRELSRRVGLEYYTFISQIESGRGRIPTNFIADWARAVHYPPREFAIHLMEYYDPVNYELIFSGEVDCDLEPESAPIPEPTVPTNTLTSIEDRMDRLEKLISKIQT